MKTGIVRAAAAFAGACLLSIAQPALAGNIVRDGFTFPKEGEVKIVVFRPDVQVGSLRVGGLDEPNADWTAAARTNMQKAFETAAEAREAKLEFMGDPEGENAKLLDDYRGLFQVVSNTAMTHGIFFDKLPTKLVKQADPKAKKKYRMDWSLGPEAAKLREATGADYAMFVYTKDSYGDAGRKVAQLLMAGLFGSYMPAGVHVGYAGLVDLKTGDLVWLNADIMMGGDPRDAEGATKRVSQLMTGFPKRSALALEGVAK